MSARAHLVIVLPGIGGTALAPPGALDDPLWQGGLSDIPNVLRHPERLSLAAHEFLEPIGLINSRTLFGLWTVVPGYDRLLKRLNGLPGAVVDGGSPGGPRLAANVVAVGYDFRRSIVEAAHRLDREIKQRLPVLWPGDKVLRPRAVIVAHSMGGLVARYWAAQEENWRLCRAIVTLGTPHRGAPKALEVWANGVPVKGFHIRRPIPVLREWPGLAELLPQYPAVLDTSAGHGNAMVRRPHELPINWLQDPAARAYGIHEQIRSGWEKIPRSGPHLVTRIGFGHGTLRRCVWDGTQMQIDTSPPDLPNLGGWVTDEGDGTVPTFSALPPESDLMYEPDLRVEMRHGPIVDLPQAVALIEGYERNRPLHDVHGEQRKVGVGVDLDEIALSGAAIPLRARVLGTDTELAPVAVWASVGAKDIRLEWDPATTAFTGVLPGLPEGLHRVVVSAPQIPGGGGHRVEQWIEVIDDVGLE